MFVTVCFGLAVIIGLILLFLVVRWKISFSVLSKYGIKGPPPELYYGNTRQILSMTLPKFFEVNVKKYGNVFCYFIGLQPHIVVNDLEIIKQIMVKQFDSFMDRPESVVNVLGVKTADADDISRSKGDNWRRQRKILSRTFSTGKLRMMGPLIEDICTSLVDKLEQVGKDNQSFDIWNIYGLFTLSIILRVGFGHSVNLLNGEEDEFTDAMGAAFKFAKRGFPTRIFTFLSNFPFMARILVWLFKRSELGEKSGFVRNKIEQLVQERLHDDSGNYQDLLQLLVDAKADSDEEDDLNEGQAERVYKYKLTEGEINRNALLFVAGGFETTQNTLSYTSYLLTLHPDKQEKIFEEIDEFYDKNPDASLLEASQNIKYVEMAIQESLRMYPVAQSVQRKVVNTTTINGQTFPEGCNVVVPVNLIHSSLDIWPEPTVFRPERFTKEEKEKRNPMAHMPFGYGPRQCIAMRLALMEVKMALVAILKEYRFVETPDTEKPLKIAHGITASPKNGVYLSIEKR